LRAQRKKAQKKAEAWDEPKDNFTLFLSESRFMRYTIKE
jgi:hypothetical protein